MCPVDIVDGYVFKCSQVFVSSLHGLGRIQGTCSLVALSDAGFVSETRFSTREGEPSKKMLRGKMAPSVWASQYEAGGA